MTYHPASGADDRDVTTVQFGEYLRVLRTRATTITIVTLVVATLAMVLAGMRAATFESTASVLVRPVSAEPVPSLDSDTRLVDIVTEQQIARSIEVATRAADRLDDGDAESLLRDVAVEATEDTLVLRFVATADSAAVAAERAEAFAAAYLDFRVERATEALTRSRSALEQRYAALDERVAGLTAQLVELREDADDDGEPDGEPATITDVESERSLLQAQLAVLASDLGALGATDLDPGQVISPAAVPTRPTGPGTATTAVISLGMGVLLGLMAAFLRDRTDPRVRHPEDVERALGAPVLGQLPDDSRYDPDAELVLHPHRAGLRTIAASLTSGSQGPGTHVLVLAAPGPEVDAAGVAVGLARALASRRRVLLVDAEPEQAAVSRRADVPRRPGLVDAAGKAPDVHVGEDGEPDVVAVGGHDPADADLGHAVTSLRPLLGRHDLVVVHAGSTDRVATAIELLELPGAVLVPIVRLGHTRRGELASVHRQVVAAGVGLLGAVVLGGSSAAIPRTVAGVAGRPPARPPLERPALSAPARPAPVTLEDGEERTERSGAEQEALTQQARDRLRARYLADRPREDEQG